MKPKRKFYSLTYPEAMIVAKQAATAYGEMDWQVYRQLMTKYEDIRQRRIKRALEAGEPILLSREVSIV